MLIHDYKNREHGERCKSLLMMRDKGMINLYLLERDSLSMEVKVMWGILSNMVGGVLHDVQRYTETGFPHVDIEDIVYIFQSEFMVTGDHENLIYI